MEASFSARILKNFRENVQIAFCHVEIDLPLRGTTTTIDAKLLFQRPMDAH